MTRRDLLATSALAAVPPNLPGLSLAPLRARYRQELFDRWLPFMERYVIDHEYGGFLCNTDHQGVRAGDNKMSWFEGRGIWVYSFLYNHLAKEEKHLDVARRSVEFILHAKPADGALWPRQYARDGRPLSDPDTEIYGTLFLAEGLAEYSKATGDRHYWEMAKRLLLQCVAIYDQPDYQPEIGRTYLGENAPPFPGARIQGVWMMLLRVTTQMLEMRADPELEKIAARSVDAVMNHHYNPSFGLNNELLNHELSRPDNEYAQLVYAGHAIETLWMVLYEAARLRNKPLFDRAAGRFQRHVEVAWDDVYGGVFRNLQNVDRNLWSMDKVLWAQEEVLIGALFIVEHTGAEWAKELFRKTLAYVLEKYPLTRLGSPLWMHASDRKVTLEGYLSLPKRVEHYHHPRHLMLNLLSVERMLRSGGVTAAPAAPAPRRLRPPLPER